MQREDALHPMAEAPFADRDGFAHPGIVPGDQGSFERLQPFLVAFLDLDVHTKRVAGTELRNVGAFVFVNKFRQQRVIHLPASFSILQCRSGRNRPVFSTAACRRQRRICSWFPLSNTSGTRSPRNSAGRVYCGQSSIRSSWLKDSITAESSLPSTTGIRTPITSIATAAT